MLYFDNAATSWPKPEVVYEMHDRIFRLGGNAGRGVNQSSLRAGQILFQTREILSKLFGIKRSDRIIFTQNITESLNIGLQGLLRPGDHVVISALEHNAVVRPLEYLKQKDITYSILPCSKDGVLDLESAEGYFQRNTRLLCCTHASNVLGNIMPIQQLGQLAKKYNALFMVDTAQTAGVLPIHVESLQIDFLAFTGHKGLMGPQGVGGFYLKPGIELSPLLYGGTGIHSIELTQPGIWPEGMESGTRNTPGIAALGESVRYILGKGLGNIRDHELKLMHLLLDGLQDIPGTRILGPKQAIDRIGLVSCTFENFSPDHIAYELDRRFEIVTRSGLHCAPLAHQTAGTLEHGAIRFSIGYFQTESDIQTLLSSLKEVIRR